MGYLFYLLYLGSLALTIGLRVFMLFLPEDLFHSCPVVMLEVDDWLQYMRLVVVISRVVAALVADPVFLA